ncbi:nitroreductase [Victivallis vadensis]|uniref:Nitroreductase n=1 Tax=Victivallis vadensis TaxID=172901 RepID=A0A848B2P2_9BACT|nr:nitroreductase family protein [Victivallis vadensis]NMD87829.1 nitroreductase [Victivallis vadensis]
MIAVDAEKCVRCGACVRDCIVEVLKPGADGVPCVASGEERFCLNCQHCLAVCPQGAVVCNGVTPEECAGIGPLPGAAELFNLLRQRRSIRQYRPENLEPEIIDRLVEPLAWIPTGCNDHRLFFTVIREQREMAFFRAEMSRQLNLLIRTGIMRLVYPGYKRYLEEIAGGKDVVFRNAPHMIVAATPRSAPCKEADPWIALSYFDLFAQTLGVGTCWCGFAVHAFRWNRRLRKRLNLPPGYRIGAVMLFGKPDVQYARAAHPRQTVRTSDGVMHVRQSQ